MPLWLIPLLLETLPQVPVLAGDAENLFQEIAHGEGGQAKIVAVLSGLANLAQHASAALGGIAPKPAG